MRSITIFILALEMSLTSLALAAPPHRKPHATPIIESEAGLNIPKIGVAIDGIYEKKLDHLIPGYKLLLVVVTNQTTSPIYFDPKKDRWFIRDHIGRLRKGINHPRFVSQKLWNNLSERLKKELAYPDSVQPAKTAKIDLLFPESVVLENFRELRWKSFHFKKEFRLHTAPSETPLLNTSPLPPIINTLPPPPSNIPP